MIKTASTTNNCRARTTTRSPDQVDLGLFASVKLEAFCQAALAQAIAEHKLTEVHADGILKQDIIVFSDSKVMEKPKSRPLKTHHMVTQAGVSGGARSWRRRKAAAMQWREINIGSSNVLSYNCCWVGACLDHSFSLMLQLEACIIFKEGQVSPKRALRKIKRNKMSAALPILHDAIVGPKEWLV